MCIYIYIYIQYHSHSFPPLAQMLYPAGQGQMLQHTKVRELEIQHNAQHATTNVTCKASKDRSTALGGPGGRDFLKQLAQDKWYKHHSHSFPPLAQMLYPAGQGQMQHTKERELEIQHNAQHATTNVTCKASKDRSTALIPLLYFCFANCSNCIGNKCWSNTPNWELKNATRRRVSSVRLNRKSWAATSWI